MVSGLGELRHTTDPWITGRPKQGPKSADKMCCTAAKLAINELSSSPLARQSGMLPNRTSSHEILIRMQDWATLTCLSNASPEYEMLPKITAPL